MRASRPCLSGERYIWLWLPVIIDTPRNLAFIKLHPSLLLFHRPQKNFSLFLAHLTFLLRFSLRHLTRLRILIWLLFASSFYFAR